MSMIEEKTSGPTAQELRVSAVDTARWAAVLAGIVLEAELVAVGRRDGVPFGEVLVSVTRRTCATTAHLLVERFPGLETAGESDAVVAQAVEWLRARVDEVAVTSISYALAAAEKGRANAAVA